MRIRFERSGGFAGRTLRTRVDTASLPHEEAEQLACLVSESRFFELPAKLKPSEPAPDRFTYVVTIESGPQTHTIQTTESSAPSTLLPLLTWLTSHTRGRT